MNLCKKDLKMLNIVLIGLSNKLPEHDDEYELHRLLSTLLSMELSVDEKIVLKSFCMMLPRRTYLLIETRFYTLKYAREYKHVSASMPF